MFSYGSYVSNATASFLKHVVCNTDNLHCVNADEAFANFANFDAVSSSTVGAVSHFTSTSPFSSAPHSTYMYVLSIYVFSRASVCSKKT